LVTGTGDTDNASFTIGGTTLRTNSVFDFETKTSYSIRVQADDGAGGTFAKAFTVTVTNVDEQPTDLSVTPSSIAENQPLNTTVGTFASVDPDAGNTFTYTVAGGSDDASFTISGSTLKTNAVFDFETKSSYAIK